MRSASILTLIPSVILGVVDRLRRRRSRRRPYWAPYSLIAALAAGAAANATTVTPPSFAELVREAQTIARGTVTAIDARWVDVADRRVIKTFVTFAVEQPLKGTPPDVLTLVFLGGTVGTETLHVSGMPTFKTGDKDILFLSGNGVQFCPLVRLMHGRYRVRHDGSTQRDYVARDDDTPLASIDDVQLPPEDHGGAKTMRSAVPGLTPDDFAARIASEVARNNR